MTCVAFVSTAGDPRTAPAVKADDRPIDAAVEIAAILVLLEEGLERVEEGHAALVEHGYSMSWSARSRSVCGIVRLRAFAVLRLITNSNLVGCSTGRSAGLVPLRILMS